VVTSTRSLKTSIVVRNQDTAVLGGLMTDQENESVTKIPILGDIPILGWLFKAKTSRKTKTNLVLFITPQIIRSEQDSNDLLTRKINERIDFIQTNMGGQDPHGYEMDKISQKASQNPAKEAQEEEPAIETF